jgi:hypothetical protein
MTPDEIKSTISNAYPLIQKYYGKGKLPIPKIDTNHKNTYALHSGEPEATGHSKTTKAQYDHDTNIIWLYYPNIKDEEDVLRSLIHEYTHYRQDHKLFKKYKAIYSYDEDPTEIEAHKNEEDWHLFSQK